MYSRNEWLFTVVVDASGVHLVRDPYQIGNFTLTRMPDPLDGAEDALQVSLDNYNYRLSDQHMRMRCLIVDTTLHEARREGLLHAREALMLFRNAYPFAERLRVLDAGYLVDLQKLAMHPFLSSPMLGLGGALAIFDDNAVHPITILNQVMRVPEVFGELGGAVRRSVHWADLSNRTEDLGERFFMKWLSVECLCRDPRDPRDQSINAKIAAAAMFPNHRFYVGLPESIKRELNALPTWVRWRRRITALIDKLRDIRNSIVHSGYRELELQPTLTSNEVYLAKCLLRFAYEGVQHLALNALERGITTISELWDDYAECLQWRTRSSIVDTISGTIIFSLENPSLFSER